MTTITWLIRAYGVSPEGYAVGETGQMVRTTVLPQLIPRIGEGGHGQVLTCTVLIIQP